MSLEIYYRGLLDSCNYDCHYCPFAKHKMSREALQQDQQGVERFVSWVQDSREQRYRILFTPWGEALIHRCYQQALITLSHDQSVEIVAIQTNLSCSLSWLEQANRQRLALWISYHPSQISLEHFLAKIEQLQQLGIQFSIGMVALPEHYASMNELKNALPKSIPLWLNAAKEQGVVYEVAEQKRLQQIDPNFALNLHDYPTFGKACRAGQAAITVDHLGTVRRCHFVDEPLGCIYSQPLSQLLAKTPQPCPQQQCDCFIGHIQFAREEYQRWPVERLIWRGL